MAAKWFNSLDTNSKKTTFLGFSFLSGRFGLLRIINCICNINRYMGLLLFFSFRTLTFMANLQPKAMWKWKTLISAHYLQTFCFQYYIYVWLHTRYIVQRKSCKIKSTHSDFRYEGNVWLFNVCIGIYCYRCESSILKLKSTYAIYCGTLVSNIFTIF